MRIRKPVENERDTIRTTLLLPSLYEAEEIDPVHSELDKEAVDNVGCDYWMEDNEKAIFIAEVDGELVGIITMGKFESPPIYSRGSRTHIDGLYVMEEYRQQGIASRLIEKAEEWARTQDCDFLASTVDANNKKAQNLFSEILDLKQHVYKRKLKKSSPN